MSKEYKEIVRRPYDYVQGLPCKNIRKKVAEAFNYFFKVSEKDLNSASELIDMLHNASLVIDDIEDGSILRRGQPAAHIKYGVAQAINAANYVYFEVAQKILEEEGEPTDKKLERLSHYIKAMISLHTGQGMELYWRDENAVGETNSTVEIPTEQEYLNVIVQKTSGLFLLLTGLLNVKSSKSVDVTKLANLMGQHFQIRDDLLNLISNSYESGKGFCEDISEGKFSYPIIYALNRKDELGTKKTERLLEILRLKPQNVELKKEALEIIKESGAIDYTKSRLKKFRNDLLEEIERLGGNPIFLKFKDTFSESV